MLCYLPDRWVGKEVTDALSDVLEKMAKTRETGASHPFFLL